MAALAPILSIAGTVIGAYGAYSSMQAQADAATYQAKVAERDAFVADQNRKATLEQSAIAAADKRREHKRVLATMRAAYGASGVELAGSPLDVLTDTAYEQETDVRRIEYEGKIRGREGALQMLGYQESATLSKMEAASARRAAPIAGLSYGFSGVGTTLAQVA